MSDIDPNKYYRLTVVCDTNDADYITKFEKVSGKEIIEDVMPIVEALRRFMPSETFRHNWPNLWDDPEKPSDIYDLTEEQVELFNECYLPSFEGGTHTIKEISISEWKDVKTLFIG